MRRRRLIDSERDILIQEVRQLLADTSEGLGDALVERDDIDALDAARKQLDDFFLIVVVGEFNAGKSAFINALIGSEALEEGVTPTTRRIQILTYGANIERTSSDAETDIVTAPVELLRDLHLVDTPGTNAIDRRHEAITRHFVPRADLVLFVTSADRPFTESERAFLERVQQWGKKIVVIVNKVDILAKEADWERIRAFIAENFRRLLGTDPEIFPVSSRQALAAKLADDSEGLEASLFPALEEHVIGRLGDAERFRLKLLNPLGVVESLCGRAGETVAARLEVIEGDLSSVREIEGQLDLYERDMQKGFELRLADVDLILHRFESSGHEFFDEIIRVGRVFDLMNKSRVKEEFERLVVSDAPRRIEDKVDEIIDWLVSSDLEQWRALRDHFERRKSEHSQRIVGRLSSGFDYDRTRLLNSVGRVAQETLENYNQSAEAGRMAESVQNAVANAALLEVGAVGLGAAVTLAATSTAADVTGLVAAGTLATIGFLVLPQKRRRAKKDLNKRVSDLRAQLTEGLRTQFESEIQRSKRKIQETIEPYTRFVRGERDALAERRDKTKSLQAEISRLKGRIDSAAAA